MLGKLLKYEMKATGRVFLPLYIGLVMVSILVGIFFRPDFANANNLIAGILGLLYFAVMVAIVVVTFVMIIQRFYKNLLSDEGYLMFTLPVKTWQLVTSKLLAATIWSAISTIASVLSILLIAMSNISDLSMLVDGFKQMMQIMAGWGFNIWLVMIETILLLIVSLVSNILLIYSAIAVGHMSNRKPILFSVVAYIAFLTIYQIVTSILMTILDFMDLNAWMQSMSPETIMNTAMFGIILLCAFIGACSYIITIVAMKKRLNLA